MEDVLHLPDETDEPSPPHFAKNGGPRFSKPRSSMDWPSFHFVGAKTAETLVDSHPYLTHVAGHRLEDVLGGTAEDAVGAIENGDVDDILHVVLWAERQTDERVTVIQAIGRRSDELDVVDAEDQTDSLAPTEITTG